MPPSVIPNSPRRAATSFRQPLPPLDDETLQRKINHVIRGVTGIPGELVRPRWSPEPVGLPTITTNWIAFGETQRLNERGTPYMQHVGRAYDVDGEEIPYDGHDVLIRHEIIVYLASCYGPACYQTAALLRDGVFVMQNWEELLAYSTRRSTAGRRAPPAAAPRDCSTPTTRTRSPRPSSAPWTARAANTSWVASPS